LPYAIKTSTEFMSKDDLLKRCVTLLALSSTTLAFAGCASGAANGRATIPLTPDPDAALIHGWGDNVGTMFKSSLQIPLGARVNSLYVFKVDGTKVKNTNSLTRIAPGAHELLVSCNLQVDGTRVYNLRPLDVIVEAGHVYDLRATGRVSQVLLHQDDACHVSLIDRSASSAKDAPSA
jgi:hypothetical protein